MTTNNDHAAALELWEAMGEVEGLRPKSISLDYDCWKYQYPGDQRKVKLEAADALHILSGRAERWLLDRYRKEFPNLKIDIRSVKKATNSDNNSLPADIRAEAGRG